MARVGLGAVTMIAHAFTGAGFGFHGDELQFMDDARHLAWRYVAYPPMTPFFARLSLDLFGTSIAGFRFFASLAQAVAIILAGLMAREMGGGVRAQVLAGAALVPYALGAGAWMVYNSFDNTCWILAAWFVVKLLRSGDARWWVAVGAAAGFGMMAKYAMAFSAWRSSRAFDGCASLSCEPMAVGRRPGRASDLGSESRLGGPASLCLVRLSSFDPRTGCQPEAYAELPAGSD